MDSSAVALLTDRFANLTDHEPAAPSVTSS